jgi:hypothetical protein
MAPQWKSIACPLCKAETGGGRGSCSLHIATHLEEIALAAIPAACGTTDESDSENDTGEEIEDDFILENKELGTRTIDCLGLDPSNQDEAQAAPARLLNDTAGRLRRESQPVADSLGLAPSQVKAEEAPARLFEDKAKRLQQESKAGNTQDSSRLYQNQTNLDRPLQIAYPQEELGQESKRGVDIQWSKSDEKKYNIKDHYIIKEDIDLPPEAFFEYERRSENLDCKY